MAKALNIGRVSGLAVALGVGAAIAANPGVAYAEDSDASADRSDSSASDSDDDTSADTDSAGSADDADNRRPLARVIRALTPQIDRDDDAPRWPGDRLRADRDEAESDVESTPRRTLGLRTDADADADSDDTDPAAEPAAEVSAAVVDSDSVPDFQEVFSEVAVVERVQQLFAALTSPEVDETEPEEPSAPEGLLPLALSTLLRRPDAQPVDSEDLTDAPLGDAPEVTVSAAAAEAHDPNPFRVDDPLDPAVPDFVYSILAGVQGFIPDEFDPIAREAAEATFRISQMVPWVNFPVPAVTIVSLLESAVTGDKAATQRIIEQLILTVPVAGIAYWGYDQVADTLNYEAEGAALKRETLDLVWDTIDFAHLLHP